jgi:DNA-binding protein HU-beta
MNKAAFAKRVSEQLNVSEKEASVVIDAVLGTIIQAVTEGESVVVTGFGTFLPKVQGPRLAHNPQTGGKIEVPEKIVVRFRPGQSFQDLVGKNKAIPTDRSIIKKAPKGSITQGKGAVNV